LALGLNKLQFDLDIIPLYDTVTVDWSRFEKLSFNGYNINDSRDQKPSVGSISVDLATLTSASTAKGLAEHIPQNARSSVPVVSIGPITTKAAEALGFKVVSEASCSTIDSLVEATVKFLTIGQLENEL
jgi:hypothetical protein